MLAKGYNATSTFPPEPKINENRLSGPGILTIGNRSNRQGCISSKTTKKNDNLPASLNLLAPVLLYAYTLTKNIKYEARCIFNQSGGKRP